MNSVDTDEENYESSRKGRKLAGMKNVHQKYFEMFP